MKFNPGRNSKAVLRRGRLAAAAGIVSLATATGVAAQQYGAWGAPVSAEQGSDPELNTAANDGCPILSPDGLSLYMATNRPGGFGGNDIWVARRSSTTEGFGAPVNLGPTINSPVDDFCPSPVRGKGLYFVSRRDDPNGDIYFSRLAHDGQWDQPVRLGPNVNSEHQEWSPSYFVDEAGNEVLYFSSTRPGGPGGQDIWYSVNFGPAQLAPGNLNTPQDDARPNVRRNGREIVFDSTRPGGLGGPDIYVAARASTAHAWPAAVHLPELSSDAPDTRASFSWDGSIMVFGSARAGGEGSADIYVATRPRIGGAAGDD